MPASVLKVIFSKYNERLLKMVVLWTVFFNESTMRYIYIQFYQSLKFNNRFTVLAYQNGRILPIIYIIK